MNLGNNKRLQPVFTALSGIWTLSRLEWVGTLAPLAFLGLYHYLILGPAHALIHSLVGMFSLGGILALIVMAFSRFMFYAIRRLQQEVEDLSRVAASQNAQLRALNDANLALSQQRLVSSVLQQVVDLSRELVQARYASLSLVDDDGKIKALFTSGLDPHTREAMGPLPTGKGILGLVLQSAKPLRIDDIAQHPASVGFPPGHPPMATFLGAPIRYQGQIVGSLYLTEKVGRAPFTKGDEEIVQLFANQAAVAIQNARLYEQVQALAVETERSRISREMHDGLAQVLGYVNTKAQAVGAFLTQGEVQTAQEHMKELAQAARSAYQDIREGILALRVQVGSGHSLLEVLEEFVSEYQRQWNIPVQICWDISPADLVLSPLQEVQVLRIMQEALTNVRKHAEASEVSLSLLSKAGDLLIEVRDNGKGFNPLAIRRGDWPHLGLQTMQERTEAIGGAFEVDSAPGRGTNVRVRVPQAVQIARAPQGAQ